MKKGFWYVALRYLLVYLDECLELGLYVVVNYLFTLVARPFSVLRASAIFIFGMYGITWFFGRNTLLWKKLFRTSVGLVLPVIIVAVVMLAAFLSQNYVWQFGRSRIARLRERRSALMQELKLLAGHQEDTGSGNKEG
jgi:hypothetical protein